MRGWKTQSIIIAALAVLLLPAVLYLLRVPLGLVLLVLAQLVRGYLYPLLMILMLICPCVSAQCGNCSCDTCAYRVIGGVLLFVVGIPLLLYFTGRKYHFT